MQIIEPEVSLSTVTPLSFYLKEKKAFLCLGCTLPICVEEGGSGRCAYEIAKERSDYFMDRYVRERERILGHPITEVECKGSGCTEMVNPHKAKSGYCRRCYKREHGKREWAIKQARKRMEDTNVS